MNRPCFQAFCVLVLSAAHAAASPPVPFPPGTDLDGNGAFEREYSRLSQRFLAPAGAGRIGFDWQAFTSEGSAAAAEDVWTARVVEAASGAVLAELGWAVDLTPSGYVGSFTPVGVPPFTTTGMTHAVPGGFGLTHDAYHLTGGTGWSKSFLSVPAGSGDRELTLEFLVADAVDFGADTSLAIDGVTLDFANAPTLALTNASFESQLAGWQAEGNAGSYTQLVGLFSGLPEPGTSATNGKWYGLISTGGGVPEPGAFVLMAGYGVIAGLLRGRRGRPRAAF